MNMPFPSRYQLGVVYIALLHQSCCLEVSSFFNNAKNSVFSTQGKLLTTSECYCWEGPSQSMPFFPLWSWQLHDLCTCFHAILSVWVVSSLCWAARKGNWQVLERSHQAMCPQENGCATLREVKISWQLRAKELSVKGSWKIQVRQNFQLIE